MWLPVLIAFVSCSLAILVFYAFSKNKKREEIHPVEKDPEPPVEGDLPKPIDWESLSCEDIKIKISDIKMMLLTSKWSDPRIYPFWVEQVEIGEKVWVAKCDVPAFNPLNPE